MPPAAVKPTDRLRDLDIETHNHDVQQVWDAYRARRPIRVPMILGTNTRYFMFNREANPTGLTFRQYLDDPDVMFDAQLAFERWSRFNLLQDAELGLPEAWHIKVDFQNFYEAAWFGCPIEYMDDQVPDTQPAFAECPEKLLDRGLPDPFGGLLGMGREYYEHFRERAARDSYLDRPIRINPPGFGLATDGPFTVACNLFSPSTVCMMMSDEPQRLNKLLSFIVDASIARIRAWRTLLDLPEKPRGGLADDSIALISTEMYREHVLPHHRRYMDALFNDEPRGIHLCGNATRHFKCIAQELNVESFDTGFPVDFGSLRSELGPDIQILGGPHVQLLLSAIPQQVREETRRILSSGIMEGGRFILREGNNLAPGTPIDNLQAMYETCRQFGNYIALN